MIFEQTQRTLRRTNWCDPVPLEGSAIPRISLNGLIGFRGFRGVYEPRVKPTRL